MLASRNLKHSNVRDYASIIKENKLKLRKTYITNGLNCPHIKNETDTKQFYNCLKLFCLSFILMYVYTFNV